MHDRSENEKRSEAREVLKRYFEHLFANSRDIMNLFSLTDGKILITNAAAQAAMGYGPEELSDVPVDNIYPPEELGKLALAFERLKTTGYSSEKLQMYARNGELCDIWTRSYVIQHEPEVVCLVHTIDITEENRKRERELLEARLASLGEASATLAHELKNALQSMQFSLGTLRNQIARNDLERAATSLSRIERAVTHMDDVITGIDKAARTTSTGQSDTSPVSSVQNALQIMRGYLEAKAVEVSTEFEGEMPLVHCNRTQLEQIVIVLVKNAAQAMASRAVRKLHLRVFRADECVRIEITDTGGGLPQEVEPKIYEAFTTTKPSGLGMGLGLSTAKRLADSNGIVLSYASTPGTGTTFTLTFAPVREGGEARELPLDGKVLLLVGDDPEFVRLGTSALSEGGGHVLVATSPAEAIQYLRVHSIAGVICDDTMYPVGGRAFVNQARQFYRGPVCLVTHDRPSVSEVVAEVDVILSKPLAGEALVTTITTLLA